MSDFNFSSVQPLLIIVEMLTSPVKNDGIRDWTDFRKENGRSNDFCPAGFLGKAAEGHKL